MCILINFSRVGRNTAFFSPIGESHHILEEIIIFLSVWLFFFAKVLAQQIIDTTVSVVMLEADSLFFGCGS